MKNFAIDASIAAKWFFREKGTPVAESLIDRLTFFFAPDFFLIEMDSVISKKVRRKEISIKQAQRKNRQVRKLPYKLVDYESISRLSFELATSLPITLYDANYLATAIEKDAILYTADQRLANGLNNTMFGDYVETL